MTQILSEKNVEQVAREADKNDTEKAAFDTELGSSGVVVFKAGVVLRPQPTADPLDPLNWSWLKKHTILGIVMYL